MNGGVDRRLPARLVTIGGTTTLMVVAIMVLAPSAPPGGDRAGAELERAVVPAASPILAEAEVFRTLPDQLGVDPAARPRLEAHPRSMAIYRRLRAYPGAPPRIPHSLTREEAMGGHCNSCHERGGFVERFAAYAPITPHPERSHCLQCHVADDRLLGLPYPDGGPDAVCAQCHVMEASPPELVALDWPEPRWPATGQVALPGAPPAIPHDFHHRGNCLACHGGPSAVAEIRTSHPERANCRQCHLPAGDQADAYTRPGPGGSP